MTEEELTAYALSRDVTDVTTMMNVAGLRNLAAIQYRRVDGEWQRYGVYMRKGEVADAWAALARGLNEGGSGLASVTD